MKWVFLRHELPKAAQEQDEDRAIKPSFCHPLYYKERIHYILQRYGAQTTHIERIREFGMDLGGALMVNRDRSLTVELGKDRVFSCWLHQIDEVIDVLEKSKVVWRGQRCFWKFARWPGAICFVSDTDLNKILPELRRERDSAWKEEQAKLRKILSRPTIVTP